jgi:hypothetical protein
MIKKIKESAVYMVFKICLFDFGRYHAKVRKLNLHCSLGIATIGHSGDPK